MFEGPEQMQQLRHLTRWLAEWQRIASSQLLAEVSNVRDLYDDSLNRKLELIVNLSRLFPSALGGETSETAQLRVVEALNIRAMIAGRITAAHPAASISRAGPVQSGVSRLDC